MTRPDAPRSPPHGGRPTLGRQGDPLRYLPETVPAGESDSWLDFDAALAHLGVKKGTLYKLTARGPFHYIRTSPAASSGFCAPSATSGG
jgi:hypothetical protein